MEAYPPKNYFEDPEVIEAAHGDAVLLERLVALKKTQELAAANPNDSSWQTLTEAAEEYVESRQRKLGLLPPETPDNHI